MKKVQDELEIHIQAVPKDLSLPKIFNLIQKAYDASQNKDMLSHGNGMNNTLYGPNSRTSNLGRGGEAVNNAPSSPLSVDQDEEESDALMQQLKGYLHGQ